MAAAIDAEREARPPLRVWGMGCGPAGQRQRPDARSALTLASADGPARTRQSAPGQAGGTLVRQHRGALDLTGAAPLRVDGAGIVVGVAHIGAHMRAARRLTAPLAPLGARRDRSSQND